MATRDRFVGPESCGWGYRDRRRPLRTLGLASSLSSVEICTRRSFSDDICVLRDRVLAELISGV
jgi:hypothetical protein